MDERPEKIELQIRRIENTLREMGLYSNQRPDDSAFDSNVPFCYDTMSFLDWLQWVMFPKTRELISRDLPLPTVCEIQPLAEEEFKLINQDTDALLTEIGILIIFSTCPTRCALRRHSGPGLQLGYELVGLFDRSIHFADQAIDLQLQRGELRFQRTDCLRIEVMFEK